MQLTDNNNINQTLTDLIDIYNKNPKNYRELNEFKDQVESTDQGTAGGVAGETKVFE